MKLIVGLGNPGAEYEQTRHNVGFMLVDSLAGSQQFNLQKKFQAETCKVGDTILAKPQTFMNDSGRSVRALVDYYRISLDQLWVIHDDLDIKLGEYKIQIGTGPKVHNGVNSVEQMLGTKDFWHVRIGVDNRTPEQRSQMKGREYVLKRMTKEESESVNQVIGEIEQRLEN